MNADLAKIRQFGNIEFLAKQLVEGFVTGLHKSPYHGFSVEFAEHKFYNTGESTRHIDWKLFARTDRLYTKKYEEETNLRCYIVLDNSSSMYYPENNLGKITYSIMAAAALIELLHRQRDAVGLIRFSSEIEFQSAVKSTPAHAHSLFLNLQQLLSQTKSQRTTSIAETLHLVAEKIHKRSLVILFTDMFEPGNDDAEEIFRALQHLKHNRHEVIIFHTIDKKTELDFEFDNRMYEFADAETGEKIRLFPHQIRQVYGQKVADRFAQIKLRCGQFGIDFIEMDIATDFATALTAYLIKRRSMQ